MIRFLWGLITSSKILRVIRTYYAEVPFYYKIIFSLVFLVDKV